VQGEIVGDVIELGGHQWNATQASRRRAYA
jgi:hypothetical protein